ncbi:MAG: hypothetical protein JXA53_00115 [Bacteroidales bacterium]|nr:hypothetical protein [Bacteroidales bacterium]
MKKIGIIITALFLFVFANGQYDYNSYLVSQQYNNGTARFMSMGGAFGALGGDLSTLSYNPAGLGVYRRGDVSLTTKYTKTTSDANFLNSVNSDFSSKLNINNFGIAIPLYISDSKTGLVSYNLGFAINRNADFNSNTYFEGTQSTNSLVDIFVDESDGYSKDNLDPFGALLAYETYLTDLVDLANNYYAMHPQLIGTKRKQARTIQTKGYSREFAISQAANIGNKFFVGATIGISSFEYTNKFVHSEETFPLLPVDTLLGFDYLYSKTIKGIGANLKVGAIFQPSNYLRLGIAVHTPTYYSVDESYYSSMKTSFTTMISSMDSPDGSYKYINTTALKGILSAAFIYKSYGLISVDYELVDYSIMNLNNHSDYPNDEFTAENKDIRNIYGSVGNLKVGAELNFGNYSLRGGYAYYPSPIKEGYLNSDANRSMYSGGLGYKTSSFYLDAAYVYNTYSTEYLMYNSNGYTSPMANISNYNKQFIVTAGFRF